MVLSLNKWQGKIALVTGASAGIGAAIAQKLVEEGLVVAGVARRTEKVDELAKKIGNKKGKLYAVKADITIEEDIIKAFQWVTDNLGPVSVLVNNAGAFFDTTLSNGDTKLWKQIFDTNVLGVCIATREAVKGMRAHNIDGQIIHINSVLIHHVPGFPEFNVFPASKHAITALTETLRQELNQLGSKIKVSSISPGLVNTESVQDSYIGNDKAPDSTLQDMPRLKPEDIAEGISFILSTPAHVQIQELTIQPLGGMF